jgi:hypothetical protein
MCATSSALLFSLTGCAFRRTVVDAFRSEEAFTPPPPLTRTRAEADDCLDDGDAEIPGGDPLPGERRRWSEQARSAWTLALPGSELRQLIARTAAAAVRHGDLVAALRAEVAAMRASILEATVVLAACSSGAARSPA